MDKYNNETFINKAVTVHGDRYDYSLTDYVSSNVKVKIICKEHGVFEQMPYSHLNGCGCPECSGLKKRNTDTFIEKAKSVHGDRYDYSKTVYVNKRSKVLIGCSLHGFFSQVANNHLRGQGCPECGKKYAKEWRKNNYESFISESKKRFGDIYEFPDIENLYENSHSKINVKCKKCGTVFTKIACDHLTSIGGGCPTCNSQSSYSENELFEYVSSLVGVDNVIHHDRSVLNGREIDIYIPSMNIGIEYNGIFWHTEAFNCNKNYHLLKTEECSSKGIRLIHVFEDEYCNHKEIVLNKIKHLLNKSDGEKVYARKTTVSEIEKDVAYNFLEENHIQGFVSSTVYLGCFYNNILIGVMSFKKVNNSGYWELTRFASKNDVICCGIGGKLFSYFVGNFNPVMVKSFADKRWTTNNADNIYIKLGFYMEKETKPDYRYVNGHDMKRFHKFGFRKKILSKKYGLSESMTETEMAKELNLNRIWDCGLIKYVWKHE